MDAIGIDPGTYHTVLACVKQKGIEIVLSETSERVTPSLAAYTDQERLIGASANNQFKKNFKSHSYGKTSQWRVQLGLVETK